MLAARSGVANPFRRRSAGDPGAHPAYTPGVDVERKIEVLAGAAKYDVSCASSGSRRAGEGTGNASVGGICHSWSDDGRCISLLKILFSNHCIYDCAYCANRASNPVPRASFTVDEVVRLTMEFYRRNYIEGLFLSSGVVRSPDHTMEELVRVVERLRVDERFHGYIHLKAIPGASPDLVRRAGLAVDRLSVNIELPSEVSLRRLAPEKSKDDILRPMASIAGGIVESRAERRRHRSAPAYAPAGQSTQLIVGASPEDDRRILDLAHGLYRKFGLKRVYYSAYVPVNPDPLLPPPEGPPDILREHRLYQADWLVRLYGFAPAEIVDDARPNLDRAVDPKTAWALRHPERFPVEVNRADRDTLLRVPGIGFKSAARILATRRFAALRAEDLAPLGIVLRRAHAFLTCGGRRVLPPPPRAVAVDDRQPELFAAGCCP
ncbi:MAG: putative DNA modification/repair radical SAM protein [Lentisphaerae bacterium]|nr:putative DNA modification/repair radical SAM protein [Lentisphaerota bacterium]